MIIIIVEITLLLWLCIKLKKGGMKLTKQISIALFVQLFLLIIYRLDLLNLGRVVYYSDAEVYWKNTLILLNGGKVSGSQIGYIYFSFLIQVLSPFQSVIWNNISNILLIDLSALLIADLLQENSIEKQNIKLFINICIYNPLVIYSLMRNMKDALFLFLAVCLIYLFVNIFKKFRIINLVLIVCITAFISTVRPWGFLIIPLLLLGKLFEKLNIAKQFIKALFGVCLALAIIYYILSISGLWHHVQIWAPVVFENAEKQSILSLLLAPFKILIGPGIYRSIMGEKYFMFYTISGNAMCAIGAFLWWCNLSSLVANYKCIKINSLGISIAMIWLFFLIIYSMQYGGSLELRFRGVIYILTAAMYISNSKKRIRSIILPTILVFCFISIVGTIAGL